MIDFIATSSVLIFISMVLAVATVLVVLLTCLIVVDRRRPSLRDIERTIDNVSKHTRNRHNV